MNTPYLPQRLIGLDVARFIAFIGMIIVNFSLVLVDPNHKAFSETAAFCVALLEGKAAATFVVLAGMGLGLAQLKKGQELNQCEILKRALFLLVIGLWNITIFDADILHFYAFYFLFGVLMLPMKNLSLILWIFALNILSILLVCTLDYDQGWHWESLTYEDLWSVTGFIRHLFFNGFHPVVPWLGFFLFGIVLSRISLHKSAVQNILIAGGLVTIVTAEMISNLISPWLTQFDPEFALLTTTSPIPPMPLFVEAGLGYAILVIGLCLKATPWLAKWGLLSLIANAGKHTLTLYIAHIVIGMGVFEMLGMFNQQSNGVAVSYALIFALCSLVYAHLWQRFFQRGPLETLMRQVTRSST